MSSSVWDRAEPVLRIHAEHNLRSFAALEIEAMSENQQSSSPGIASTAMPESGTTLGPGDSGKPNKTTWTCANAWSNFYVNQRGEIFICCLNDTKIGDLNEMPFMEAWSSGVLAHIRALHLADDYHSSSCMPSCHMLVQHFPENYSALGSGFPGYKPEARTGNAYLDNLPQSPFPVPLNYVDNAETVRREMAESVCRTASFPTRGLIIPIQKCNLRCPMCDTGVLGDAIPNVCITEEQLEKLRPVYPYLDYLEVVGGGEIFYFPPDRSPIRKLLRDLQHDANPALHLLLQTNGIAMNRSWVDTIVETNIASTLNISIDTVDPEVYKIVRKGGTIQALRRNLDYLEERKAALGLTKPQYRFSVVMSELTYKGLLDVQEFAMRYPTSYFYMQILQKGGHPWFVDQHNIFRPQRREELIELRNILEQIHLPSNKDSILQIIETCLKEASMPFGA
jgi:MoaA/NifB/PqqE/SkfB family radical SAM enzyme